MSFPSLLLCHPERPLSIDATATGIDEAALDALPWDRVAAAMAALEGGAIANPDEGRQVGHYWLRAPDLAPDPAVGRAIERVIEEVTAFADRVRTGALTVDGAAFTDVLHVGIGGSALGPELLVDALGGEGLPVSFLDNTDPDGIERVLRALGDRLATTLVVVVSKSGGTPETANAAKLAAAAIGARGLDPHRRMVAITAEGSPLDRDARSWLARFPMWDWVGGRCSVTSAVGLLPAALAGIDVAALLRGAREMDGWTRRPGWRDNPAAVLAGCWFELGAGSGERNMVVLPYSDRLVLLSRYLQQLVMESLGKRLDLEGREVCQGLTVYGNKGSTDQHAYVQQLRDGLDDFFVQFVQVLSDGIGSRAEVASGASAGDFLQGFLLGTRRALREVGRPSLVLTVPEVSARELGAMIALFERAVGMYATLVGINAYHQPGVEAGKRAAGAILELAGRVRAAARQRTLAEIAAEVGADPTDVFHLLSREVVLGRLSRTGTGADAIYGVSA